MDEDARYDGKVTETGSGNGTGTTTYSIPTTFDGNDGTISQTSGGTFVATSLFDLNGGQLTLSGAGNFIDFDDVEDGDLVVATSGSGTVTLAGTVPGLTGSVIVDSGTLVLDGDLAQARKAQEQVAPLARLIYNFGEPGCGAHQRMKVARWLLGRFPSPHFRRPVRPLSADAIESIRRALAEIGFDSP